MITSWLLKFLALLLLGLTIGVGVTAYINHTDNLANQAKALKESNQAKQDHIDELARRDEKIRLLQNQLTELDTQSTQALYEQLHQNDLLRHDLDTAQRMRLRGTSCPAAPAGSQTAATSSMGDDPGIELSAETRQAVFDLRAGILDDKAKIDYLQGYLRRVGLSPPAKP